MGFSTYIPLSIMQHYAWRDSPERADAATATRECVAAAERYAFERVEGDATGHDRFHLERVRRMALRLGRGLGADLLVVEVAALLHDTLDAKLGGESETLTREVHALINGMPLARAQKSEIWSIIRGQGFVKSLEASAGSPTSPAPAHPSAAFIAVQDADRLDAMGALGIARCFAYGGHKGQPLHDPALTPREGLTREQYRQGRQSSLNHFHEKLFRLRERLHTDEARALADGRHTYMLGFIARFEAEWQGEV